MTSQGSIRSCAPLALLLFAAGAARADDPEPGETIVIEGRVPEHGARDRDRALDEAPFVRVLHPDEHPATASVADAIATSAGATRRSLGGLGAFASISIRGASPGHTAVLVDGVPLAKLAQVTVDLGRFAMDSFGEVELYRGAVPIELGGAGVGGAVNLVTRLGRGERGERMRASIGAGSFGARHARFHYGDDHGRVLSSMTVGYQGATGDYAFFTDNGTPLNRTDDTTLIRDNNGFDQLDAAARAGDEDGAWAAGLRTLWKDQGLPGSITQPAADASMSTIDVIADGRADVTVGSARARQLGYVLVERQVLNDPQGELGLGTQDRRYLTLAGGASTTWTRNFGGATTRGTTESRPSLNGAASVGSTSAATLGGATSGGATSGTGSSDAISSTASDADARYRGTLGLELRGERFTDADRDGMRADLVGSRVGGAISAALDITLAPALVVTPAVRVDLLRTAPTPMTVGPDAFAEFDPRWDAVPSPRVTARAGLGADVAVKSSAGWYVRLPTLLELFGDRGYIVGSPDLAPERGPMLDAGFVWAPAEALGAIDRVLVEAVAFGARARDTIALISTAGFVARAENIGATQTFGGELVASARVWRRLSASLAYTRLVTEQRTIDPSFAGKDLPRTPGHQLHARVDCGRLAHEPGARATWSRLAGVWIEAGVQSSSFLDRANIARVPGRVLVGVGGRIELMHGLAVAIAVENLADTRVVELPPRRAIDSPLPMPLSDVAGFPLPGRSFYLSFDWSH